MENISNAYLVLSVAEIRALLRAAELEQTCRGNLEESVCLVLQNITVLVEEETEPQIASWSINKAVADAVNLSLDELADAASRKAI